MNFAYMLLRAIIVWLGLMVLAILNGTVRQYGIIPFTGERAGHWISTVMLCGLILGATYLAWNRLAPRNMADAWEIGILWLALTMAFEFLAGHFLFKRPWAQLFADYDILNGRIWVLVLIITLIAPRIMAHWRGLAD